MNQIPLDLQPARPEYRKESICPSCEQSFRKKSKKQVYCSRQCAIPKRKAVVPTQEEIDIGYRRIALTRGQFAFVDAADYDWLMQWNWFAQWQVEAKCFYAIRNAQKRYGESSGRISMHRAITGASKGQEVDHINTETLNNRRSNLRVATSSQNKCNIGLKANNTSGLKGVDFMKKLGKWRARARFEGKDHHLGLFMSKEDAHRARTTFAAQLHGDFFRPG